MGPKDLDSSAIIVVPVYTVRKIIYFSLSIQNGSLLWSDLQATPHTER